MERLKNQPAELEQIIIESQVNEIIKSFQVEMEKKGIEINPEEIEFRYDFQVYGFNKMYIDPEKALRRSQDFIYHYEFIALLGEAIEKAREEKHTLVNQSYETIRDRALEIIDEELNLEYATPRYNLDGINEIKNQIENDMIQVLDDRIQEMIKKIYC